MESKLAVCNKPVYYERQDYKEEEYDEKLLALSKLQSVFTIKIHQYCVCYVGYYHQYLPNVANYAP